MSLASTATRPTMTVLTNPGKAEQAIGVTDAAVQGVEQDVDSAAYDGCADPTDLAVEQRPGRLPMRCADLPRVKRCMGKGAQPTARMLGGRPPAAW